jgi:pimeloyl-ACP methyl ester carboxylesterase
MSKAITWLLATVLMTGSGGLAYATNPPSSTIPLSGGKTLPYFVSAPPGKPGLVRALIGVQGFPRDANRTFDAIAGATHKAGKTSTTLLVAPIFPVPAPEAARHCHFKGMPDAAAGNALWHCGTWLNGAPAINSPDTSFEAMNRLVDHILAAWPSIQTVTIAGFSAGGQFVQRYAAFSHPPARSVQIRYVVADPSGFLYFDPFRPLHPAGSTCPNFNQWKFGTENLPSYLGRSAQAARAAYVAADIHYLEGVLDSGEAKGTAYRMLEKNCAAEMQGQYRLDRGEAYAAYDKAMLAQGRHELTIVPGCAHNVTCVLTAPEAQRALFGQP